MHTTERDLTGIRFAYGAEDVLPEYLGTPIEPRYRAALTSKQRTIDNARARGGIMIESDEPIPPSETETEPTYRLNLPGWRDPEIGRLLLEHLMQNRDIGPVSTVDALPLSHSFDDQRVLDSLHQQLENGQSFVLAFTAAQRGHGKYLIERSAQLERVRAALDAPQMWRQAARWMELRPFIVTPSNRYTSYRVVASPVGALLAASLLYSGHTDGEERIIQNDRFDDAVAEARGLKECFEDPASPYFLASRDIRSNVSAGGGLIPLMGSDTQRAPITSSEAAILAEHRLSNVNDNLNILAMSAAHVGRVCGPELDLCIGIDYAEDAQTNSAVLLEINFGPAPTTYNMCWLRGEAEPIEANYLQRQEALDSISTSHNIRNMSV